MDEMTHHAANSMGIRTMSSIVRSPMTSAESAPSASKVDRLGPYAVVAPLAAGGMADVYLCQELDRYLAIKVLDPKRSLELDACRMFLDEARLVGMLDHQNIAAVVDVDIDARRGLHYIAMEYVHGKDLREMMIRAGHRGMSLPYEVSIAVVMQAAAGLHHAHNAIDARGQSLHLVHRDVSLSNIMVGFDGIVKLVDFGIARSTMSSVHTMPGIVRGKASYMSPEQCMGEAVDHRTDVFALGVVLYELTTGARCFAGKTDFEKMLAVVRGDYVAPSDLVADYPIELEQIVRCALSPDADQRFPSCAAMFDALDRVLSGRAWLGGVHSIQTVMQELFGNVREPWAEEDVTCVDIQPAAALPPSPPTRPITRSKRLRADARPLGRGMVAMGGETPAYGSDGQDGRRMARGSTPPATRGSHGASSHGERPVRGSSAASSHGERPTMVRGSSSALARGSAMTIDDSNAAAPIARGSSHAMDDHHPLAHAASKPHAYAGHAAKRHSSSIEAPTVRDPSHLPDRSESAPAIPPRRIAAGTHSDTHDPAAWTLDDDEVATRGRRALRRPSGTIVAA
jgi:serine/threonine protein kinase